MKDQAGKKRQARRLPQGCCVPNSAQSVSSCLIPSGWAPRASGRQPSLLAGPGASAQVVSAPILGAVQREIEEESLRPDCGLFSAASRCLEQGLAHARCSVKVGC